MKRIITLIMLLVFASLCGCAEKTVIEEKNVEYEVEYLSLEESILRSNSCVLGEYEETASHDDYVEHKFKVLECLYGSVEESEVYLYSNIGTAFVSGIDYSFKPEEEIYEKGNKYILIMECYKSPLFDHDRYMLNADLLLDETDEKYTIYSKDINIPDGFSVKEYICSVYKPLAQSEEGEGEGTYDDEIDELFKKSDFVGDVKVLGVINEGITHNGDTYKCVVDDLYKGDNLITDEEDGTVLLVIKKEKIETGNTYIIGFNQVSEYSLIYTQSTENSVFSENEERIRDYFEKHQ